MTYWSLNKTLPISVFEKLKGAAILKFLARLQFVLVKLFVTFFCPNSAFEDHFLINHTHYENSRDLKLTCLSFSIFYPPSFLFLTWRRSFGKDSLEDSTFSTFLTFIEFVYWRIFWCAEKRWVGWYTEMWHEILLFLAVAHCLGSHMWMLAKCNQSLFHYKPALKTFLGSITNFQHD